MYAQVEKSKENKRQSVTNSVTQKKNNVKQSFGFVDNRPEAIAQRKAQNFVSNNARSDSLISSQKMTSPMGVCQLQVDMRTRKTQKNNLKKVLRQLQNALPNRPATVAEIAAHDKAQNAGNHHANRNVSLNQLIGDINQTLGNLTAQN